MTDPSTAERLQAPVPRPAPDHADPATGSTGLAAPASATSSDAPSTASSEARSTTSSDAPSTTSSDVGGETPADVGSTASEDAPSTAPEVAAGTAATVRAEVHSDAPTVLGADDTAGQNAPVSHRHRPRRRRAVPVLAGALVLATAAAVYLFVVAKALEQRSADYLDSARDLGSQVATTEAELEGAQSELDAVRTQLATAQERIVELADEKAQLGDDREVQRQLADYQARVTDAAGDVALALDQCVQGQNQLIGYMENAAQYDPTELEQFGNDVQALCQAATEANTALQRELAP